MLVTIPCATAGNLEPLGGYEIEMHRLRCFYLNFVFLFGVLKKLGITWGFGIGKTAFISRLHSLAM